jgi:hypothetical protein
MPRITPLSPISNHRRFVTGVEDWLKEYRDGHSERGKCLTFLTRRVGVDKPPVCG